VPLRLNVWLYKKQPLSALLLRSWPPNVLPPCASLLKRRLLKRQLLTEPLRRKPRPKRQKLPQLQRRLKIDRFNTRAQQIKSVRRWLGASLERRLAKR
jgi:hypothetical protein